MNRFRFIKVRDVKTPSRGNAGDAGLDFYIPRNLDPQQLIQIEANQSPNNFTPDFVLGVKYNYQLRNRYSDLSGRENPYSIRY